MAETDPPSELSMPEVVDINTLSKCFRQLDTKFNLLIQALGCELDKGEKGEDSHSDTQDADFSFQSPGRSLSFSDTRPYSTPTRCGTSGSDNPARQPTRTPSATDTSEGPSQGYGSADTPTGNSEGGTGSSGCLHPGEQDTNTTPSEAKTGDDSPFGSIFQFKDKNRDGGAELHQQVSAWLTTTVQGLQPAQLKEMHDSYHLPPNVNLFVPPVDKPTFERLPKTAQQQDIKLQKWQQSLHHGLLPVLHACSNVATAVEKGEGLSADDTRTVLKQLVDSISLLQHANFSFNQVRREGLKPHLDPKFAPLCKPENPTGATLFGDNLEEQVRKLNDPQSISLVKPTDTGRPRFSPYSTSASFRRTSKGFDPNWRSNIKKLPFLEQRGQRNRPNPFKAPPHTTTRRQSPPRAANRRPKHRWPVTALHHRLRLPALRRW